MRPIEKLEFMEGMAWRCICHVHYFHLVSGHQGKFWPIVQNAIGESACLFWSHLFGNRKDDFHYSVFFSLKEVGQIDNKFSLDSIKSRLMNHIQMDDSKYTIFWKEVKSCRDKFIAHRDVNGKGLIFPRIDLCREMAEELRVIFSELIGAWPKNKEDNDKVEYLEQYYEWHTNRSIESKCKHEFKVGITNLYKNFGYYNNLVQGTARAMPPLTSSVMGRIHLQEI